MACSGASQHGRGGWPSRRICRGLLAVLRAASARAAYGLWRTSPCLTLARSRPPMCACGWRWMCTSLSIVAGVLPADGGQAGGRRIETTARRRSAACRPARRARGPGGLLRGRAGRVRAVAAVGAIGVACDIVAPSLVPVRAGDRVKTDRRDARKLAAAPRRAVALRAAADAGDRGAPRPVALPR